MAKERVTVSSRKAGPGVVLPPLEAMPEVRRIPYCLSAALPIFPFSEEQGRAFDEYRIIRTKILQHLNQPRLLAITSAAPRDGKTFTALNVAGVMSLKEDVRIVLIEADLYRGGIASCLGLPAKPGLAEYLKGTCSIQEALVQVEQFPNLYILCAGESGQGASELLDSSHWKNLCRWVREQFTHAIFDCPPLGAVADSALILAECDGVVFVVRPDHTNKALALATLESIPKEKLIGVVLNSAQDWFLHRSGYSYYSYYGRQSGTAKP